MPIAVPILFQDEKLVVVNKPIGLPTHKNKHLAHDAPYLTKLVGDQLGTWVYNVHRLDAKTSGVMVLARSSEIARELSTQFQDRSVKKIYQALVKGSPGDGEFDRPVLDRKKGKRVAAQTTYRQLQSIVTDISYKDQENIALSLLELRPSTGRWHQLRQHCAQARYDIIGDTQHGDWTLNRIITERTGAHRLLLHASALQFRHPVSQEEVRYTADLPTEFSTVLQALS